MFKLGLANIDDLLCADNLEDEPIRYIDKKIREARRNMMKQMTKKNGGVADPVVGFTWGVRDRKKGPVRKKKRNVLG